METSSNKNQIINELEQVHKMLVTNEKLSNIEIDLILSKLRNSYDLVLNLDFSEPIQKIEEPIKIEIPVEQPKIEEIIEIKPEPIIEKIEEPIVKIIEEKVEAIIDEEPIIEIIEEKTEPILEEEPIFEMVEEPKIEVLEIVEEPKTEILEIEEEQKVEVKIEKTQEKPNIASNYKSLNDIFQNFSNQSDLSAKFKSRPISNIKTSIGLNDKFLMINELFDGKAANFNAFLDSLDSLQNLEEATNYIRENLTWDETKASATYLIELVYRRFAV
jgi:hypothetical protein